MGRKPAMSIRMQKSRATSVAELYCIARHGIHRWFGRSRNRPVKGPLNDHTRGWPTTPMNPR